MSSPVLSFVGPIHGHYKLPSFAGESDGTPSGSAVCTAGGLTASYEEARHLCSFVPWPINDYVASTYTSADVELIDCGLYRLDVTITAFGPGAVGVYTPGVNGRRKYGAIGLWAGENFLGWRELSRLKNRFYFDGADAGMDWRLYQTLMSPQLVWTGISHPWFQYGAGILDFLTNLGGISGSNIDALSWDLAPTVVISMAGWSACAGVIRGYAY